MNLYKDAGWWAERKEVDIERMLESVISIGVWKDDSLIGFARAITDGEFRAYIEDVIIHHSYQKTGIGQELVSRLIKELKHIDVVSLFCEEYLMPFYNKNKFKNTKSHFVMHLK